MIAYCGINCSECPAYRGTVGSDPSVLEKAAEAMGDGQQSAEDWACLGCGPHNPDIVAEFCTGCAIRLCGLERQVTNCAACAEFETCAKIQDFVKGEDEELKRRMALMRQRYLAGRKKSEAEAGS